MKKLSTIVAGILFLFLSLNVNAQTQPPADYFAGKWNMLVEGLPQGDSKMIVTLVRKDGKLTGAIQDSTGKEISPFSKVEETEKSVTMYFSSNGYDVDMTLEKKDEDHVTGSMMGMFNAKGDRVKEAKAK